MRGFAEYGVSCVLIIAIVGAVAWMLADSLGQHWIMASAVLAFVLQLVAFGVARLMGPRNVMLGWGLGSALRLVLLVIYALLLAKLWRAPIAPALLSFAAFVFLTTVVEPVFLKR